MTHWPSSLHEIPMRLDTFALVALIGLVPSLSVAGDEPPVPAAKPPVATKDTSLQPTFPGDKAVVALPAPIDSITLGGGGRFVIGHLKGQRKLVIVDVLDGKVVKVLQLPPG